MERKETLKDISLSRLVLYVDSFDVVVSGTLIYCNNTVKLVSS